jgi:hypothetical protein
VTRGIIAVVLLFMTISGLACGQQSSTPLSNIDVIKMTQAGIDSRTIELAIRKNTTSFDTSVEALIRLKKAGVSQEVMDAMLAATGPAAESTASKEVTADELLDKALNAVGPRDELLKIHAMRWVGRFVVTANGDSQSYEEERVVVFPHDLALSVRRTSDGATDRLVMTRDFSYLSSGKLTRALGTVSAETYRQMIRFDPVYVAQRADSFALSILELRKQEDGVTADYLKISQNNADYIWKIDSQTGQLLSIQYQMKSGAVVTREYSDYRKVGDLTLPFKWRTKEGMRTAEMTVSGYEVNPTVDESIFLRPDSIQTSDAALNFKVLDMQSVEYAQQMEGRSASCQLSQATNTTVANPLDDAGFVEGATPSNLQMTCNAWDTSRFWPYKFNAMLVMGSDGNAYILACDQAPKWSKCVPIETGRVVNGVRTPAGIEVPGKNAKGQPQAVDYLIIQTKVLP